MKEKEVGGPAHPLSLRILVDLPRPHPLTASFCHPLTGLVPTAVCVLFYLRLESQWDGGYSGIKRMVAEHHPT